ncbi:diacylglycerol kinase [Gordonia sinesedis]
MIGTTGSSAPVRVTVVANPYSRHGAGLRTGDAAVAQLRERGLDPTVLLAPTASEAAEMAAAAARAGTDALIVVGGDGTVRLTVEASLGTGTPVGIVPAGSGNDAARNLGIPLDDVPGAVDIIARGVRRSVDVGQVTFPEGRTALFATVAATGFDASVASRADAMSWPHGQSRYTVAALREMGALSTRHYQVRVDDEQVEGDVVLVAIGNTASYGGGMRITPGAAMDDGALDVTVARVPKRFTRATYASMFPRVFTGHHVGLSMVETLRGREIELYCDPPAPISLDGDIVGELPAVFEVLPDAAQVFVPSVDAAAVEPPAGL